MWGSGLGKAHARKAVVQAAGEIQAVKWSTVKEHVRPYQNQGTPRVREEIHRPQKPDTKRASRLPKCLLCRAGDVDQLAAGRGEPRLAPGRPDDMLVRGEAWFGNRVGVTQEEPPLFLSRTDWWRTLSFWATYSMGFSSTDGGSLEVFFRLRRGDDTPCRPSR